MKLKLQAIPVLLLVQSSILFAAFGYDYGARNQSPSVVIGVVLVLNAVMFFVWDILTSRMNEKLSHACKMRVEIAFAVNIISLAYIMAYYKDAFMSWSGHLVLQSINIGLGIYIILQIIQFIFPEKKIRPSD